jgi:multidrug efflux pump subunit AcrA (membrane-fusion protein)
MKYTVWLLSAAMIVAGGNVAVAQQPGRAVLNNCHVSLIDEANVPAQEAGRLIVLEVEEGDYVEKDALIARIDDDLPHSEKLVAEKEEEVSRVKAESDVEIRVAFKAAMLAKAEYDQLMEAIAKAPGAKTEAEKRIKIFQYDKAVLQKAMAEQEQSIAKTTVEARVAQVAQAQSNIERRQIVAPLSGEVAKVHLHLGEWASPGAPVLRIVSLDRLRVEGWIDPKQHAPSEVANRPVTFETELTRGRKEKFTGKITYVNFEIEPTGMVRVRAEVVNRKEDGQWLLRPGATGDMSIEIGAAVTTDRRAAEPAGPKLSNAPIR